MARTKGSRNAVMKGSSVFIELCNIANGQNNFAVNQALQTGILATPQGKECGDIINQYQAGLLTFSEFAFALVAAATKADKLEMKEETCGLSQQEDLKI